MDWQVRPLDSNAAFFDATKSLINGLCDRHCLGPLSLLLPAYVAFNGLTDGWGDLLSALKNVRASSRSELTDHEIAIVGDLIRTAEAVVYRQG